MVLKNKNAVIYGAGGSLGSAVAKAFAAAGATVFLTGRNAEYLVKTAEKITSAGGKAETAVVNAYDGTAIEKHLDTIQQRAGNIDISYNAIGVDVKQGIPLIELTQEEFVQPVTQYMQTIFLTNTAAGRRMKKQGSGVLLSLTATPGGIGYPYTGGFAPACTAIETFMKNLASELGIYGVRAVNIRSGGSPDSRVFHEAVVNQPEIMDTVLKEMKTDTMLKKLPMMADISNAAVFLASDQAAMITGVTIDITGGTTSALNYRAKIW